MSRILTVLLCFSALVCVRAARAIEVKVSAQSLERTLKAQLFDSPDGRYYLRGDAKSACFVYAENPHVSFTGDRILVHVTTKARLGKAVRGACLGVSLATDADVTFVPEAQEESIGFRDARVERLSTSKELNFLLVPFLSSKLPQQMKVNAAMMMRQLLSRSAETTGYTLTLDRLKLHSMMVEGQVLTADLDADIGVN
ncbi:MAG TPA: hypothetical protein VNW54_02935 [Granulicella sp.]|jgi:hypothetical protein|nr:hypothetical protein [Granulicella sp.]